MSTSALSPAPRFSMTLLVKMANQPPLFGLVADEIAKLGFPVHNDQVIRETPTFVIKEVVVVFQELAQGEAILKAVKATKGAELMNFMASS